MSPLDRPRSEPEVSRLRVAWLGRVSTDDLQDPTLSLPRQLRKSKEALPAEAVVVAHFYDIESGRKDLEERGHSTAHEKFDIPIPRDGGIQQLLDESRQTDRRFDAVICESIERVARRTYYGTKIEHDLEREGVALFAADEPIALNGKKAAGILMRRVKQSVAEWYVLEILEKSWDGLAEHIRQGWNIGRPPYGYQADKIPHPVPARRASGATKTRLVPDPLRAPVVNQIFVWRVVDMLGYQAIQARLNADLERYPSPESPDPARRRDQWSRSSVRDILTNPKHTGYMVWNRRATKKGGRVNPPSSWVWSPQPTHEPIVTMEMFKAANTIPDTRQGSRHGAAINSHPDTKRSYLLRSFVFCELCGKRMGGKTMRKHSYFACEPAKNLGPKAQELYPDHPQSIYVREEALAESVAEFFARRIFGPHREKFLEDQISEPESDDLHERQKRLRLVQGQLRQIDARLARQVRVLESDDDLSTSLLRRVSDRVAELENERRQKIDESSELQNVSPVPAGDPAELLRCFPIVEDDFVLAPEVRVRELLEAFKLVVAYDKKKDRVRIQVTVEGRDVESIQRLITHVVGAPNGIRTRVTTLRGW